MKRIDALYFVEHVVRELDIACAVKYYCEKQYDLSVIIASLPYDHRTATHAYKPSVVVMPYLQCLDEHGNPHGSYFIKHWQNIQYVNLNFEQYLSNYGKKYRAPRDPFVKKYVHQHCWNNDFKNLLLDSGVCKRKIFLNGNPNFILYQSPYVSYYPDRQELAKKHNLDSNKRWLLFPENYWWAFLTDEEIQGYIDDGYNEKFAYKNREFYRKSLETVIKWFKRFLFQNTGWECIIRPRPNVTVAEWQACLQQQNGEIPSSLKVIKSGAIRQWILASDVVISSFSTTLLDAVIANKPVFIVEPLPFFDEVKFDFFNYMHRLRSEEEFITALENVETTTQYDDFRRQLLKENLGNGDPILGIAEFIHQLVKSHHEEPQYIPSDDSDQYQRPSFKRRIRRYVKHILKPIFPKLNYNQRFEADIITNRDIKKRVVKWSQILS